MIKKLTVWGVLMAALPEKNREGKDTNSGSELEVLFSKWLTKQYFTLVGASNSVPSTTGNPSSAVLS